MSDRLRLGPGDRDTKPAAKKVAKKVAKKKVAPAPKPKAVRRPRREKMDFSRALEALKQGLPVSRTGWNGRGQWVSMQRPTKRSKMTLPYLYIKTKQGGQVPWLASQTDLLAEDWVIE